MEQTLYNAQGSENLNVGNNFDFGFEHVGNNDHIYDFGKAEANDTEQLIMLSEKRILKRLDELENKINSFPLKQVKRRRTQKNRCQSLNRKGEMCNGFCCTSKSSYLCYAHYVLLNKQKRESSYLYQSK